MNISFDTMNTANSDHLNLSPEQAKSLLSGVEARFKEIFSEIKNFTPCGKPVTIEIEGEVSDLQNIGGSVERISNNPYTYKITFNTGLIYHLWKSSCELVDSDIFKLLVYSDKNHLSSEEFIILSQRALKQSFWLGVDFVILHEFSHVHLGHSDYLHDSGRNLEEIWNEGAFEDDLITIRKILEADADRFAGKNLVDIFNVLLKRNEPLFSSKISAYSFYAFTIASIFHMLQDSTNQANDIYPKSNERMYIVISQLLRIFENESPLEHDNFILNIMLSALLAGEELGVVNAGNIMLTIQNACKLERIDKIIEDIGLRQYQHRNDIV